VVHLEPRAEPLVKFADQDQAAWFNLVVKAAFGQRRKTLLNSLTGGLGMTREQVEAALKEAGIDPRRRAETLSSPEFGLTAQSLARRREGA
jgi:16S rRNA (adenine1518-N6/adenine1519-N6)-dimethyltransferase